jgi:hypothetical protein
MDRNEGTESSDTESLDSPRTSNVEEDENRKATDTVDQSLVDDAVAVLHGQYAAQHDLDAITPSIASMKVDTVSANGESYWFRFRDAIAVALVIHKQATEDSAYLDIALLLSSEEDRDRIPAVCLADILVEHFNQTDTFDVLTRAVELYRSALLEKTASVKIQRNIYRDLVSCFALLSQNGARIDFLSQGIELQRQVVRLLPSDDSNERVRALLGMSELLRVFHISTGDSGILEEAIDMSRQALKMCKEKGSLRRAVATELASNLALLYQRDGDVATLQEAISLLRAASRTYGMLSARRIDRIGLLASLLTALSNHNGDDNLLEEAITLQRWIVQSLKVVDEASMLQVLKLGTMLCASYQHSGDDALLNETINAYKALPDLPFLSPIISAHRHANTAVALCLLYLRVGDEITLDEAVDLQRLALKIQPENHFERPLYLTVMSELLRYRYDHNGDIDTLEETMKLDRAVLDLCTGGHPFRPDACFNLATSLLKKFDSTADSQSLDEAIELQRAGLSLRLETSMNQSISKIYLAEALTHNYRISRAPNVIIEARKLCSSTLADLPPPDSWRGHIVLAELMILEGGHLAKEDLIADALGHLSRAMSTSPGRPSEFVARLVAMLHNIEELELSPTLWCSTASIYSRLVDMLPLLANRELSHHARLEALRSLGTLGSDAFTAAMSAQKPALAIELAENIRTVVWSQALKSGIPDMDKLPEDLASQLRTLLQTVIPDSSPLAASGPTENGDQAPAHSQARDLRHEQNTKIQAILQQVRELPDLERFMLGQTYDALKKEAKEHPVIVLAEARQQCYALIIRSSQDAPEVVTLSVGHLEKLAPRGQQNMRGSSGVSYADEGERGMLVSSRPHKESHAMISHQALAALWEEVVKPILGHLQLEVRRMIAPFFSIHS